MPRKKNRDAQITVRMRPHERRAISRAARVAGESISEWARAALGAAAAQQKPAGPDHDTTTDDTQE